VHSGTPSPVTGKTVQEVTSTPIPTTWLALTPDREKSGGMPDSITVTQSAGSCSAQSCGSRSPVDGSVRSITALGYGTTSTASSSPEFRSSSSALPDSVPKSTPIAYALTEPTTRRS